LFKDGGPDEKRPPMDPETKRFRHRLVAISFCASAQQRRSAAT